MKPLFLILPSLLLSTFILSQTVPNIEWVENYSERDSIVNVPSAIDANNNVYITGYTFTGGSRSFTTIKYDQNGNLLWVKNYDGPPNGDDRSHAVKIDPQGNIVVVGESEGFGTGKDFTTIKYDQNGNELWVKRFDGAISGNDFAYNLDFDIAGNVYVTGKTQNTTNHNVITIKYSPIGVEEWTYISSSSLNSKSIDVIVKGNFVYTLSSQEDVNFKTELSKINKNTGILSSSIVYQGASESWKPNAFAIHNNTVAIVGEFDDGLKSYYYTSSINSLNLAINWTSFYDDYNADAVAYDVTFNSLGEIISTGTVKNGALYEYHTVNYSGGNESWINKVPTNSTFLNAHPSIAVDNYDHFYICGEKMGNTPDVYIYQISDGGNLTWEETYNGLQNGTDAAVDIVSAGNGVLYVAAQTQNSSAKFDYTTIKVAQTPVYFPIDVNNEEPNNLFSYFENNGQLLNSNGTLANEVLYYANNPNHQFYISKKHFSFVKSKYDSLNNVRDTVQRIDMIFQGNKAEVKPFSFENIDFKQNYYLSHCPNGIISNGHNRLMFPNYYDGIDLHLFNSDNGMKYYFMIKPNADPSQISHFFSGASNTQINNNGQLAIGTFDEDIILNKPKAYQMISTSTTIPVSNVTWNNIGSNSFNFNIPNYNPALPLVIQIDQGDVINATNPKSEENLIWSTYYGGQGRTIFEDVANDQNGNVFYAGTANNLDFASIQGLMTNVPYAGGIDAITVKLNNLIEPQWATYFGGSTSTGVGGPLRDQLNAIAVNANGTNVYIVGRTNSSDLPINNGGGSFYSDPLNDGIDAFIARFDGSGVLQWSTYFGGTGEDEFNDLAIDPQLGYVYAVGRRSSNSPLQPITGGANFTSGYGSFLQFDASNNLIWANAWDCKSIEAVGTDFFNRFYFTGTTDFLTSSSNLPIINADPNFPSTQIKQPNDDVFVSALHQDGSLQYSFFYGGKEHDRANDLVVDKKGNVYLAGTTTEYLSSASVSTDLPNAGTGLPLPLGDNLAHGFIAKIFPYDGTTAEIIATSYIGSLGADDNLKLAVNENQVLFVAGKTYHHFLPNPSAGTDIDFPSNQPSGFYTVETRPTSNVDVYSDAFVAAFNKDFNLIWSTYFGGNLREWTNGISFSPNNDRLYFAGYTTTNNAELNPGDNFLPNFDFNESNFIDYWQEEPFQETDSPAWAAFFDVQSINDPTIDVEKESFNNHIIVYPNPTHSTFNITSSSNIKEVIVYDMNGRALINNSQVNNSSYQFNAESWSKGVYLIKIYTESEIHAKKLIIQ